MTLKGGGDIINGDKMEQVRCKKCGKRLFDGSPGWDIVNGKPKTLYIICPRCGKMNTITCEMKELTIVKLIEEKEG